jgi:hypothetical protein
VSDLIRKKLLTNGLFSASQEKQMIPSSPLRERTSFLTVENFNKLSLTEISEVIQHQKKRNDEMERKCQELEKENHKDSKNNITQQFNLFDIKKKILSSIEDFNSKTLQISKLQDGIDLLYYQNDSLFSLYSNLNNSGFLVNSNKTTNFVGNTPPPIISTEKRDSCNYFEVNDINLVNKHMEIVQILDLRAPPSTKEKKKSSR